MLTSDADGSLLVTDDDGPRLNVTTMLVVREGGERLHATLRALLDQRRRPDRLVIIGKGRLIGEWDKAELLGGHANLEEAYWSVASEHAEYGTADDAATAGNYPGAAVA